MNISGKLVLVTGASRGIGAAIARAMARAGAAQVLLLARTEAGLKAVADEIRVNGGTARCYKVDLSDRTAVENVVRRILGDVGVPDIIINNAGSGRWRFLTDTGPEEIEQIMALPYFAAAWITRGFLPGMVQRNSGHIVNISSVASRMAWPGATAYIAACRAMRGLSDALRADLHRTGIAVTHYESGPVDSPYWQNNAGSRDRVPKIAAWLVPTLKEAAVAEAVVAGVTRNRRLIVVPTALRAVYLLHFCFPWLVQWLVTVTGYRAPSTEASDASTN